MDLTAFYGVEIAMRGLAYIFYIPNNIFGTISLLFVGYPFFCFLVIISCIYTN